MVQTQPIVSICWTAQGRPVLVCTTSVEVSEIVSSMLTFCKISHKMSCKTSLKRSRNSGTN